MKHYSRLGFLLGTVFFIIGVQPLWAGPMNISIAIEQGSQGGYSYSGIHAGTRCSNNNLCMGGDRLYWPFSGNLIADFDDVALSLTNIHGTLTTPSNGSMQVTGGSLTTNNGTGKASGSFDYILEGDLDEEGTFYFVSEQLCCNGAPYGGPNSLTANGFTLWGNNWDILNGETRQTVIGDGRTALGIDIVGGQYMATPEPSTILLFGTGLLALPFLRRKKV